MVDMETRRAVAAQLHALAADGRPLGSRVAQLVKQHGVTRATIYRWASSYGNGDAVIEDLRVTQRFEMTLDHLTVVAHERTLLAAWKRLVAAGSIECSYPTFARAANERVDPTLLATAIDGYKGMVNNRNYLQVRAPHRNHTWHLDHTPLDVWVIADHRTNRPTRPWVTAITDSATGLVFAIALKQHPTAETVAAALVEAATVRPYGTTNPDILIGGTPQQIVLDNAAEHFADAMKEGVERLQWVLAPSGSYASWQNGKAEAVMRIMNAFAHRMPGATHAGKDRKDQDQFSPAGMQRPNGTVTPEIAERMLGWNQFVQMLQMYVDHVNTQVDMDRLGGQTRLEAWRADPTELTEINPHVLRSSLLPARKKAFINNKNGLQVRNVQYVSPDLEFGRSYMVRAFYNTKDSIEVFTENWVWVTTAYRADRLDEDQLNAFMGKRSEVERQGAAIEHGAQQQRDHEAALINAHFESERFDDDDDLEPTQSPPATRGRRQRPPAPVRREDPNASKAEPIDHPLKTAFAEKHLPKDMR